MLLEDRLFITCSL